MKAAGEAVEHPAGGGLPRGPRFRLGWLRAGARATRRGRLLLRCRRWLLLWRRGRIRVG